jgi:hypothetical protein
MERNRLRNAFSLWPRRMTTRILGCGVVHLLGAEHAAGPGDPGHAAREVHRPAVEVACPKQGGAEGHPVAPRDHSEFLDLVGILSETDGVR